jgi:hypothetical protein
VKEREMEELNERPVKEPAARKKVEEEELKAALEAELSVVIGFVRGGMCLTPPPFPPTTLDRVIHFLFCFEIQANKMVATERIKRAETEDELKEAHLEKESLRSALRLLEDQHSSESSSPMIFPSFTSSPSPLYRHLYPSSLSSPYPCPLQHLILECPLRSLSNQYPCHPHLHV